MKRIAEQNFVILKATVDHVNMLINKFEQIKGREDEKDQIEKMGHEKRTRAKTQKQVGIKEK